MRRRRPGLLLLIILAVVAIFLSKGVFSSKPPVTPAAAIAYSKAQLGKPYVLGGTGPDVFDCSGLIQQAYHWSAGLRTSQQQWAGLHHVKKPHDGDLVFFHGVMTYKGEQPPGHVGIIVSVRKKIMIDAYARGFPVEYDTFGLASSKPGLSTAWGYASP